MYDTILNRENVIAKQQEGGNILRRWITNKRQVPEVLSIANEEEIREPDYKISNPSYLTTHWSVVPLAMFVRCLERNNLP